MAKRPDLNFLIAHPAHFFALGCGSGLAPKAPGTFGTLFAWAMFVLFHHHFSDFGLFFVLTVAYLAGIWFIDVTGRGLGDPDHGSIVWDEIVPFWLILMLTPTTFLWQLAAFVLFRFFDITKPQPARYFDEHVKNGFGVMADDLVAAGYTLLSLALLKIVLA
ncbi:MAG: phosphatidylglycerophosphatase A [Gammaproteobacteria bacterium]|nr:phosphatidylglycerophosphatase A [Gammaproteobacteria bacterium]MBU1602412.1 phosphatidylglycerophosphatase A [Gammaproteobacteria bacterium]MBU2433217.1 phosphatidylglycerophosphatase A [Gammaproteobacteria bacterium]MBU2451133.1 phosphatidylglycerophosphatase A [Gammaproteobacteria bacterium]